MTLAAIVPIVEGHSEVESVPVLMRRIFNQHGIYDVEVAKPVRVKRYQVVKEGNLENAIGLARLRPNCGAIVIILDAEDDCPKELVPSLLRRARQAALDIPVSVVLPKFEFESWFVGSIESLRGVRGITDTAHSPPDAEAIRGAKEWLSKQMQKRRYVETDDQPALAERFSLAQAHERCRSFRKFMKDLEAILNHIPRV